LTYWHRTLRDAPAARLPYDSQDQTQALGRAYFLVEEDVMQKLDALAKAQRVSLGLVCYAALQIALARWCGQDNMVTGLIAANRIRPQFQGTVGSLLSIIPVASRLSPGTPFRSFLMGFAKAVFDGIAHQDISVDNYNEIFRPPEPLGVPRFNFVPRQENFFVGAGEETPAINGVQSFSDIKRNSAYTDVHFLMLEYPKGLLGRAVFAKTLSFAAIKRMVESYQAILRRIAADPDIALDSLV
jgi:non-ribosomal peptide synthetase component F